MQVSWNRQTTTAIPLSALLLSAGCVVENIKVPANAPPAAQTASNSAAPDATSRAAALPVSVAAPAGDAAITPTQVPVTTPEGAAHSEPVYLLVSEYPPGPTIERDRWGGVLRYSFSGNGAASAATRVIDKSLVADPAGLAFRPHSSELLVANRHGNIAADGVPGSISRFVWNEATQTFTPHGTITGNALSSVAQLAFNPVNGELFAGNWTGNIALSRFVFDSSGAAVAHGTMGSGRVGGLAISRDGKRLYATDGSTALRQFDLKTETELPKVSVPSNGRLDGMTLHGSDLYVGDQAGRLFHFTLNPSGDPMLKEALNGVDTPLGIALSPDGTQLFTAGHKGGIIDHFNLDPTSGSWRLTGKTQAPTSLGFAVLVGQR